MALEQGIQPESPPDHPGYTRIYVAVNGKCIGSLVLIDKLRKDARKIVQELKRRADVWMVTGDEEQAAVAVAPRPGLIRCAQACFLKTSWRSSASFNIKGVPLR